MAQKMTPIWLAITFFDFIFFDFSLFFRFWAVR